MTRETTLGNSTAQKLRTLKDDVESLPDPSTLWTWQDGLDLIGPSSLEKLKAIDAVEKVSHGRGGWWRVTPRVAEWIDRVHDVSPSGGMGQDTLPVGRIIPGFDSRSSRSSSPGMLGQQIILTGDLVTVESGLVEFHVSKGQESKSNSGPVEPGYERQVKVSELLELYA